MTSIDVVIVRWRSGRELDRCLDSLGPPTRPPLASVTVVDSGSGDDGLDLIASRWPDVRRLALAANLGFAAAANRGADLGSAPLLLVLNPDTQVEDGTIATLADLLDSRPHAAGCVPLLVGTDGVSQHRWQLRRLPTVWRLATGRPGAAMSSDAPREPTSVPQPAAAAWLMRRKRWEMLGGLDPNFRPAWWEDVDFCARLAAATGNDPEAGFVVCPDARVIHEGGSSVERLGREAFFDAYHRNLLRYTARHHPRQLRLVRLSLRLVTTIRGRPGIVTDSTSADPR